MTEPTRDEAVAALEAGEPAEVVRPARTLVIDVACIGREWTATSTQLSGFTAYGDDRAGVEKAARANLAAWLGPHVTIEFRELGALGSGLRSGALIGRDHERSLPGPSGPGIFYAAGLSSWRVPNAASRRAASSATRRNSSAVPSLRRLLARQLIQRTLPTT